jgi:predicted transcriptional regulator
MVDEKITIQDASEVDPNLLRMLDRGLEDIEYGRTLPHEEAMEEVRRIREARRNARSNAGVVANA